jgi:hypothetical protein
LLLWLADITVKEEDAGIEKMMLIIGSVIIDAGTAISSAERQLRRSRDSVYMLDKGFHGCIECTQGV